MLPCLSSRPSELTPEQKVLLKLLKVIMSLADIFPNQKTTLKNIIIEVQTRQYSVEDSVNHMMLWERGPWGYAGLFKIFSAIAQVLYSTASTETTPLLSDPRLSLPPAFRHTNFLPEQIDSIVMTRIQTQVNRALLSDTERKTLRYLLDDGKRLQQTVKIVAALPLPVLHTELGWDDQENTKAAQVTLKLFRELLSYCIHHPYKTYWILALLTVIAFIVTITVELFLNVQDVQLSGAGLNNGTEPSAGEVLDKFGPKKLIMEHCSDSMPRAEYDNQQCHSSPLFYSAVAATVLSFLGIGGAAIRKRYKLRNISASRPDASSIQAV